MCRVRNLRIFLLFAFSCSDNVLDKSIADSKKRMEELLEQTNIAKQENEHLANRHDYSSCDLHQKSNNIDHLR
ncbi:MAG: hypothetical protein LBD32_00270 [Cytophagales bacterium]|jgi:hypothetical protein|nr:hypothetical protein [Cytophagales bacterium]